MWYSPTTTALLTLSRKSPHQSHQNQPLGYLRVHLRFRSSPSTRGLSRGLEFSSSAHLRKPMAAWLRLIRFSKHKVQAPVRTLIFRGAWMTAAIAWLEPVSAQPKQFPAVERSSSVGGLHFKEHSGIHAMRMDFRLYLLIGISAESFTCQPNKMPIRPARTLPGCWLVPCIGTLQENFSGKLTGGGKAAALGLPSLLEARSGR